MYMKNHWSDSRGRSERCIESWIWGSFMQYCCTWKIMLGSRPNLGAAESWPSRYWFAKIYSWSETMAPLVIYRMWSTWTKVVVLCTWQGLEMDPKQPMIDYCGYPIRTNRILSAINCRFVSDSGSQGWLYGALSSVITMQLRAYFSVYFFSPLSNREANWSTSISLTSFQAWHRHDSKLGFDGSYMMHPGQPQVCLNQMRAWWSK